MQYAPENQIYLSVETPSVFREALVAADPENDTAAQHRARRQIKRLAEQYRTHVQTTARRRG